MPVRTEKVIDWGACNSSAEGRVEGAYNRFHSCCAWPSKLEHDFDS